MQIYFVCNNCLIYNKIRKTFESVNVSLFQYLQTVTISPSFPNSGRKYAILEQKSLESPAIQFDDKYSNLQNFVAGVYNPKPIVDSIQEYEKYGNDGGKQRQIGTAIVNGYEAFSNIVNAAVEVRLKYKFLILYTVRT